MELSDELVVVARMSDDWVRIPLNCEAIEGVTDGSETDDDDTVESEENESDALETMEDGKLMMTLDDELPEADDDAADDVTETVMEPDALSEALEAVPDALAELAVTEPDSLTEVDEPLNELAEEEPDTLDDSEVPEALALDVTTADEEVTVPDVPLAEEITPDAVELALPEVVSDTDDPETVAEALDAVAEAEDEPTEVTPDVELASVECGNIDDRADDTPEIMLLIGSTGVDDANADVMDSDPLAEVAAELAAATELLAVSVAEDADWLSEVGVGDAVEESLVDRIGGIEIEIGSEIEGELADADAEV